jgi:hypothetical protein
VRILSFLVIPALITSCKLHESPRLSQPSTNEPAPIIRFTEEQRTTMFVGDSLELHYECNQKTCTLELLSGLQNQLSGRTLVARTPGATNISLNGPTARANIIVAAVDRDLGFNHEGLSYTINPRFRFSEPHTRLINSKDDFISYLEEIKIETSEIDQDLAGIINSIDFSDNSSVIIADSRQNYEQAPVITHISNSYPPTINISFPSLLNYPNISGAITPDPQIYLYITNKLPSSSTFRIDRL